MSRWTNSKDGIIRTELQIRFRMSVNDLAAVLAWCTQADARPLATLPATQIRELITGHLYTHGLSMQDDSEELITDAHRDAVRRAYGGPA